MTNASISEVRPHMPALDTGHRASDILLRELVIGLTAFLTVVDLFATWGPSSLRPPRRAS